MASDTRMVNGNEYQEGIVKVAKIGEYLVGYAGDALGIGPMQDFISYAVLETDLHPTKFYRLHQEFEYIRNFFDSSILLAKSSGELWYLEGGNGIPVQRECDAIGSGADYAIGAMARGASAREAVRVAMKFDIATGGKIVSVAF